MKKLKLFVLTIALVSALLLSALTAYAFDGNVFSSPSYQQSENGFIYKEATVKEGGSNRKLFYGEYNSTVENAEYEWVIHSVRNGTDTTLSTVLDIAKNYENTTNRKVMFATNGDFFYSTGSNIESYVNDGIVITKGSFATKHCIGFDNNGKAVIGRMTEVAVNVSVTNDDGRTLLSVDKFNEEPTGDEIAVYNRAGSYSIAGANKIIVRADGTSLTNYPVTGTSANMNSWDVINDNELTLKSGQFAVVTKGKHAEFLHANRYGVSMDLVEVPAGDFAGCTWVIGGYDILVNNGVVGTSFHTDNSGNINRARTLIGIKEDGTIFLCVVDETGGSTGITVTKEAELAKALGAKFALELDGGGSSTSVLRVDGALTVRNKSIDGPNMRKVSNAVMLVEKDKSEEESGSLADFEAAWDNVSSAQNYEEKFTALKTAIEKYNLLTEEQKTEYADELNAAIEEYNDKAYSANSIHVSEASLAAKILTATMAGALGLVVIAMRKILFRGGAI